MEKLTNLEEMIMKCIWDFWRRDSILQIGKELKERYVRANTREQVYELIYSVLEE